MKNAESRRRPGEVRDAIVGVLLQNPHGAATSDIEKAVVTTLGAVKRSSVRSYLRLNVGKLFRRDRRGHYSLLVQQDSAPRTRLVKFRKFSYRRANVFHADCMNWLVQRDPNSIHAIVTDPPYGLVEYAAEQQEKLRKGRGGVWRVPPSFDGTKRAPLPRFTVLSPEELLELGRFFSVWGKAILRVLVPGANVVVASNPLLSFLVSNALSQAGLERRGEIVRLVMTMRGGDRPKNADEEFSDVSVMPRSMWEPWLVFRKPLEGRVQDNLRKWKTGGFRRPSDDRPFGDVIESSPTHKSERALAPHPSLKPQRFLRTLVRGVLPLGDGIVLDTFAGAGSTLAAAEAVGYESIGVEKDAAYFRMASSAIPKLIEYKNGFTPYLFSL
ncbi:MAG TPA: DNA methyltransferase [Thermoanaerobaculia bacterium]